MCQLHVRFAHMNHNHNCASNSNNDAHMMHISDYDAHINAHMNNNQKCIVYGGGLRLVGSLKL